MATAKKKQKINKADKYIDSLRYILEVVGELTIEDSDGTPGFFNGDGDFLPLDTVDIKKHLCLDDIQQTEFYFEVYRQTGFVVPEALKRNDAICIGSIVQAMRDAGHL